MMKAFLVGGLAAISLFVVVAFAAAVMGGRANIDPCSGAALFAGGGLIGMVVLKVCGDGPRPPY